MSFDNFVEEADKHQIEEYKRSLERGETVGEGKNKKAVLSERNEVLKVIDTDEHQNGFMGDLDRLQKITGFPPTDLYLIDLSDTGYSRNSGLVVQELAPKTHEDRLEDVGWEKVLEETVEMFDRLNYQGFIYMDSKPANIGFHYWEEGFRARPLDILDDAAYRLFGAPKYLDAGERGLVTDGIAGQFDLYLNGADVGDGRIEGLANLVEGELGEKELTEFAIDASSLEGVEYAGDSYSTFEEAARKTYFDPD